MGNHIVPIRTIILVRKNESRVFEIFRTLSDACNKMKFKDDYHTVWGFMQETGYYNDNNYRVEKRPVYGKASKKKSNKRVIKYHCYLYKCDFKMENDKVTKMSKRITCKYCLIRWREGERESK